MMPFVPHLMAEACLVELLGQEVDRETAAVEQEVGWRHSTGNLGGYVSIAARSQAQGQLLAASCALHHRHLKVEAV